MNHEHICKYVFGTYVFGMLPGATWSEILGVILFKKQPNSVKNFSFIFFHVYFFPMMGKKIAVNKACKILFSSIMTVFSFFNYPVI